MQRRARQRNHAVAAVRISALCGIDTVYEFQILARTVYMFFTLVFRFESIRQSPARLAGTALATKQTCEMRAATLLSLLFALFGLESSAAAQFEQGAVCNTSHGKLAENVLADRHLVITEFEYPPFGIRNASVDGNAAWSGLDIELVELMARRLRFTYTIVDGAKRTNESWDDALERAQLSSDLVMSWWSPTTARLQQYLMLSGYVDISLYTAVRPPEQVTPSFTQVVFSFLTPFDLSAWLAIIVTVALGGAAMLLLETSNRPLCEPSVRKNGRHVVYHHYKGILWSDHVSPASTKGCICVVAFAFLGIVIRSLYLSRLASNMTLQGQLVHQVTGIQDLLVQQQPACIGQSMTQVRTLYPFLFEQYPALQYEEFSSREAAASGLLDGQCGAYILSLQHFRILKLKTASCWLHLVGGPIEQLVGGPATNLESPCVARAVNLMMHELTIDGNLSRLLDQYFPPAACPAPSAADAQGQSVG